jgi:putative inorganic carbon (hco3(-)) transporter
MATFFNRIIKVSINLLVFLIPLFFLPFSFEAFEFNKQYLLFFLVLISFFAWIGKMVLVEQEVRFKRTPLDIFVIGFLFIAVLSAVFSVDKGSSVFGFYGRFSDGLIGLLSLGALYFLITNNVKPQTVAGEKSAAISISDIIKPFMWSVSLVVLTSYFAIFGILAKIGSWLPQLMRQNAFNPVSGSMEGLAVFLAAVVLFLTGRILTKDEKAKNSANYVLLSASLVLMIIIDFSRAWWILSTSLVLFLVFALWKRIFKENVNRLLLPIFLTVAAGLFLSVNTGKIMQDMGLNMIPNLPKEQVLGGSISWQVGIKSATDDVRSAFLGTGIGTFHYDFAKNKPASFNQDQLWQIRFDRPGSHFSEVLGTMGFLGLLFWLALIGMFLLMSYFFANKNSLSANHQLPLLMAFVALAVGQFFYYQNTVLAFTFWLVLALSVASRQKPVKEKVFSFKNFPELNLVFTTILIIIGLGGLGAIFFGARFYLADKTFLQAVNAQDQIPLFEKAVKLNPYQSQYWIILARAYWQDTILELAKPASQREGAIVQAKVARAIDAAKTAVLRGPGKVAAWETQGMVYRDIRAVAQGASDWAIKSFEKAIELEPANPVLRTELAKVYIPDDLEKAKELLTKAKELKPDYADALYQEALIEEQEGNLSEAIKAMENLVLGNPFNAELRFQLGRLYYNNNQVNDSIAVLETVLLIFPNHSNALYSLGVAWAKKGDKNKARSYFEKVLELNPDNQEVKARLNDLK